MKAVNAASVAAARRTKLQCPVRVSRHVTCGPRWRWPACALLSLGTVLLLRALAGFSVGELYSGDKQTTTSSLPPLPQNDATSQQALSLQMWKGIDIADDVLAAKPPQLLPRFKNPCWLEMPNKPSPEDTLPGTGARPRLRCLPYFLLAGVDKCGTTDLFDRLLKHPQVLPNGGVGGKETHWWSWRRFGFDIWVRNKPIMHFENFLSTFDNTAEAAQQWMQEKEQNSVASPLVTGEGSPTTFWDFTGWEHIPQNVGRDPETAVLTPHCISHLTPGVKIIVLLRNPTDRLYSDYLFLDRFRDDHNVSAAGFHHAVVTSLDMMKACTLHNSLTACLYNKTLHMRLPVRLPAGLYAEFLKVWWSVFPRKQILVMQTETYSRSVKAHLQQVFSFLQLDKVPARILEDMVFGRRSNTRGHHMSSLGDMWNSTRTLLNEFYLPHNRHLAEMLQDRRFAWDLP